MSDRDKTKEELISELAGLRHRITELEAIEAERKSREEISHNAEESWYPYKLIYSTVPYQTSNWITSFGANCIILQMRLLT